MSDIEITGAVQNLEARMIETSPGWCVQSNQKAKCAKQLESEVCKEGILLLMEILAYFS